MSTPRDESLFDSNVEVLNKDPNLKAYARRDGELTETNTVRQSLAEWLFDPGYDLTRLAYTHGPTSELASNRESQAADDQGALWRAIGRNRVFANTGRASRSDVLVLNDGLRNRWESHPTRYGVGAVLALDKQGLLTNSLGAKYDTITYAHCRSNFDRPVDQLFEHPEIDKLTAIVNKEVPLWVRAIHQTTLSRDSQGELTQASTIMQAAFIYKKPASGSGSSRATTGRPLNYFERVYGQGLKFPGRG